MDYSLLSAVSPYAENQIKRHQWDNPPELNLDLLETEEALLKNLRNYKHYWQVQYLNQWVNKEINQIQFLEKISALAETLIESALNWQYNALIQRYGDPKQNLTVLGMGKLGGNELNFSSDIDLIFVYEKGGELEYKNKITDFAVFYQKLAQKLIYSLDTATPDGNVYRVDMRLRPFGQSGALTMTHEAFEQYYAIHGRDWERYALMKARPVAGDKANGLKLLKNLRPFIYRRYLDYKALHSIGEMKNTINQQINEEGMERHIKLGAGGIREAEFAVQAMQMVYGGQYPQLQQQNYLKALYDLERLGFWRSGDVARLKSAYLLLRTVENALQFEQEQQTHTLPDDPQSWARLAQACHYDDVASLQSALNEARQFVHQWFLTVFANNPAESKNLFVDWQNPRADLQKLAYPESTIASLVDFSERLPWARLPKSNLHHVEKILNQLLGKNPSLLALQALLRLIEKVVLRGSYLYILAEHQNLIPHLIDIAEHSKWLIEFIGEYPLVLDDILTQRGLPDLSALSQDLNARVANLDDDGFLHALRDFKNAQIFKTAWNDIHGRLPLMQVSDRLTHIAELILAQIYQRAYWILSQRHGIPSDEKGQPAKFALIAYGKLGGLELGYGSDLDLIFLFDDGEGGQTNGDKPLENNQFFTRLAQRMMSYLSASSTSGVLYAIDTRLRPNGQSGLLISHIRAFERYQQESAQTWEHQALTRARFILGDEALGQEFQKVRQNILAKSRNANILRAEVLEMREKMRERKRFNNEQLFHLKHGVGGLVDIEFMVQYLLLKHAHQEWVLTRMTDNIRQLAGLEATGILSSSQAMTLRDSYRRLRAEAHHRHLDNAEPFVLKAEWQDLIDKVTAIQREIFKENP